MWNLSYRIAACDAPRHRHVVKRLPHVHDRQANAPRLLLAKPVVEQCHAGLFAIRSSKPDRTFSNQVAHHDAVVMALADRDLVDADGFGTWRAHTSKLRPHVLLLQVLDCVPVKMQFFRHVLHRGGSAAPADVVGKALGVVRVVGKECEPLALHLATTAASHPPHLELEIDARIPVGQIACSTYRPVVPAVMHRPTGAADCCFERRMSVMTRALRSPNTPRSIARGRKPANRNASLRCFGFDEVGIRISCQTSAFRKSARTQHPRAFQVGDP